MKPWAHRVFGILAVSIWLYLIWAYAGSATEFAKIVARWLEFAVAATIAVFAGILAHECGHLLAGLAAGLRFSDMQVGPFRMAMDRGRLKFEYDKSGGFGGGVRMYPQHARAVEKRLLVCGAGGFVADLTVIGITATLILSEPPDTRSLLGRMSIEFMGALCLTCASHVFHTLDLRGGGRGDARQFLSILRRTSEGMECVGAHALYAAHERAMEMGNTGFLVDSLHRYGQYSDTDQLGNLLNKALDRGWRDVVAACDSAILDRPTSVEDRIRFRIAFLYAYQQRDVPRAREIIAAAGEPQESGRLSWLYVSVLFGLIDDEPVTMRRSALEALSREDLDEAGRKWFTLALRSADTPIGAGAKPRRIHDLARSSLHLPN